MIIYFLIYKKGDWGVKKMNIEGGWSIFVQNFEKYRRYFFIQK